MQSCFHCGLPIPAGAAFGFAATDGAWRAFCCPGCEAVSRAIAGLGLEEYYRLREAPAERRGDEAPAGLAAYDDPALQARFVRTGADGAAEAQLVVEGLRCAACAWLVEQVAVRVPGVTAAQINYATRRAWVRWDPQATRVSAILGAVRGVGYEAFPYEEGRVAAVEKRERRGLMRRLWIAGLAMMQVMMYAVPTYMAAEGEITADAEALMRWAGLVLTLPVMFYSASPFFTGAWRDLANRRLGMDVPVALGIAAAFAASAVATMRGAGEVYFDSVTMFVFLLTGGRYLELVARGKAAESLQHLAKLVPTDAARLVPGDRVVVPAGATLPADGTLISERAQVSEAWLTGESRPLTRGRGEQVLGGSVNVGEALELRVDRIGADTALSSIHRMMERALAERPRWVQAAERASAAFVAMVLAASVAAAVAWSFIDPPRAMWVAVSVLIVTCPCAFALATPAALTVATGRLARGNLVVTRANAIEVLARATDVVFDKTGTLTHGEPRVLEVRAFASDADAALRLAAALASRSAHPLARAIARHAGAAGPCEDHRSVAGEGLEARVEGRLLRLGSAAFAGAPHGEPAPETGFEAASSTVWLADERGWIAAFRLGDEVRAEAAPAIAALRALGLEVHLLSGDEEGAVRHVATALGIASWVARARPGDKVARVRELQRQGRRVAMVGDGLNDAPVIAQADVSVAMGSGADLAQLKADAVLLSDDLGHLAEGVRVARRTRAVVRQNVGWALAYNGIAIPLAFAGWVTPLVAGIGMSASSLVVVANALRLKR